MNETAHQHDLEAAEVRRGHVDGLVWGRDYARPDEIEALTNGGPGAGESEPYWRGFVDGAEEAGESGGEPLLNG